MYRQHFGLTELPFGLTPDTQFFCGLATPSRSVKRPIDRAA